MARGKVLLHGRHLRHDLGLPVHKGGGYMTRAKTRETSVGVTRHFSADPYISNGYSDPIPDPTPFFSGFQDAGKKNFHVFFSCNLPAGTLSSVLKI